MNGLDRKVSPPAPLTPKGEPHPQPGFSPLREDYPSGAGGVSKGILSSCNALNSGYNYPLISALSLTSLLPR